MIIVLILIYIALSWRAYMSIGSNFLSFVAGVNMVCGVLLLVRLERKYKFVRHSFHRFFNSIKKDSSALSLQQKTNIAIQEAQPFFSDIIYKYAFPGSIFWMMRNTIGLRITGSEFARSWIVSLMLVTFFGFICYQKIVSGGIKLGESIITKSTWLALLSGLVSLFIFQYFFSQYGSGAWYPLLSIIIGMIVYYILYHLLLGEAQHSSWSQMLWTRLFLVIGGISLVWGLYQNTLTWIDTHTIEKIVYKDLEVFDSSQYLEQDQDQDQDKSADSKNERLDSILDEEDPTNSIASRLLKEAGQEVKVEVTEEQIDVIQDPALKQLMLQKKIQQLMSNSNTHSAGTKQPLVISPNTVLK